KALVSALRAANVPMRAPCWVMNPRTVESLRLMVTTLGVFPFKAELDGGTLLGYPVVASTNAPIGASWGQASPDPADAPYCLMDASTLIFAEDLMPTVDASAEASIQSNDAPDNPVTAATVMISAFQQDMLFMRLRAAHTWARRYDTAL